MRGGRGRAEKNIQYPLDHLIDEHERTKALHGDIENLVLIDSAVPHRVVRAEVAGRRIKSYFTVSSHALKALELLACILAFDDARAH